MKHMTKGLLALLLAVALLGATTAMAEADMEDTVWPELTLPSEGDDMPGTEDLDLSLSDIALESEAPMAQPAADATSNDIQTGRCGDNIQWTLDGDGLLTLSGSGEMSNDFYFFYYPGIRRVVVEEGITSIGISAFNGCSTLESVSLPNSLRNIYAYAFMACDRLSRIDIPNGVPYIAGSAFARCYSLAEVSLPESVTEIVGSAFEECVALQAIDLPKSTTIIDAAAFKGCSRLSRIRVPENVSYISEDAFDGCSGLTIQGYENTVAESYAAKHGIPFASLGSVTVSDVKLNKTGTVGLKIGKTLQLKATKVPGGAISQLTWKSSKTKVATVSSSGKVKAVGKGTAVITVKADNGKSAKVTVKVTAPAPTKVSITKGKTAKLKVGKKLTLKAKLTPSYAESKLTWISSDKTVAAVSSKGVVTAKKVGTAKITVKTGNKLKATITITVVK